MGELTFGRVCSSHGWRFRKWPTTISTTSRSGLGANPEDARECELDREPNLLVCKLAPSALAKHPVYQWYGDVLFGFIAMRSCKAGHTIAAATVLPGTILYHGRGSDDRPVKLDWVATDPEHSAPFCRSKCYLYTYVTTRPLHLAHFDGSSASKVALTGTMDTQDIVIWGKVRPDMTWNETVRIRELCKWGEQFELDGFVRYSFNLLRILSLSAHRAIGSGCK